MAGACPSTPIDPHDHPEPAHQPETPPAARRGQAIQQYVVATKLKVEDRKRSLRRRIGAVDQKDIPFAIHLAHHSGKA
jgi:hypothetical protein